MTEQQALYILENKHRAQSWKEIRIATAIAAHALKKHIPKPLFNARQHADGEKGDCPNCRLQIILFDDVNYCCRCGQAIEKNKIPHSQDNNP